MSVEYLTLEKMQANGEGMYFKSKPRRERPAIKPYSVYRLPSPEEERAMNEGMPARITK